MKSIASDGFSGEVKNGSEYRDASCRAIGTETHNGLVALDACSSRRPWPFSLNAQRTIAEERSRCCAGSWLPGHTQRRLASVATVPREKTGLCSPATQWVPRRHGGSTAERFLSTRRRSRFLRFSRTRFVGKPTERADLTEGRCVCNAHIAPHRVAFCAHLNIERVFCSSRALFVLYLTPTAYPRELFRSV